MQPRVGFVLLPGVLSLGFWNEILSVHREQLYTLSLGDVNFRLRKRRLKDKALLRVHSICGYWHVVSTTVQLLI